MTVRTSRYTTREHDWLHCKAGEVGKMFGKPLSPEAPDMDEFLKHYRYRQSTQMLAATIRWIMSTLSTVSTVSTVSTGLGV